MSSDKELNGIGKKMLWKTLKQKKQGGGVNQVVQSDKKNG